MTVGAILLAAGSARRMGEDKLLANLGGKPLALHAFDTILAAGLAGPIVATAPGSGLAPLLEGRARLVDVAEHAKGIGHSLAAAVADAPADWTAAIICLADMPFVRPTTLAALAHAAARDAVIRPSYGGCPGNPLSWGCGFFAELAALTGDRGGRSLLERHGATLIACDDPGILFDVDTPDALAEARRRFA